MLGDFTSGHHENRTRDFRFSWCFSLLGWGVPMPMPARRDHAGMMMLFGRSCWVAGKEERGAEFEGTWVLILDRKLAFCLIAALQFYGL